MQIANNRLTRRHNRDCTFSRAAGIRELQIIRRYKILAPTGRAHVPCEVPYRLLRNQIVGRILLVEEKIVPSNYSKTHF